MWIPMFITELFMVVTIWKQPKYLSMDEGVRKCEMDIEIDTAIDIEKLFSLKKEMAPHSSTLAWKISWTVEAGGLQSMGLLRVGHDWATSLSFFTFMHWRRKWQPTPVFLPGESQGWGAWWASVYGVTQSRTRLRWLSSRSISTKYIVESLGKKKTGREKSIRRGFEASEIICLKVWRY